MYSSPHRRHDSKHQPCETTTQLWSRCELESITSLTQEYHDIGEKTPLHYAIEKNNYEITSLLLDNGANTTLGDKRGLNALHYAARFGLKEMVKLLLTHGADINLRDGNGFNPAHWAKMNEFNQIVDIIGPPRSIAPNDYQEYKKAMIQIHQINLKKKKKKGKKKK